MKKKVDALLEPAGGDECGSCEDLVSIEAQVEIIDEAMGKCKGTAIGGIENSIKKPPLSRGGNKQKFQAYLDLEENLQKEMQNVPKKRRTLKPEFEHWRSWGVSVQAMVVPRVLLQVRVRVLQTPAHQIWVEPHYLCSVLIRQRILRQTCDPTGYCDKL